MISKTSYFAGHMVRDTHQMIAAECAAYAAFVACAAFVADEASDLVVPVLIDHSSDDVLLDAARTFFPMHCSRLSASISWRDVSA
jgi:hypothetical protein